MLTVLDLFSGIGGFSLGLERTGGFRTVAFCEIAPFCRQVLRKHWPDVPIHGDVRGLSVDDAPDVIVGGDPCPSRSIAKGNRPSNHPDLAGYFLAVVARHGARWVVRENVLSPDALDFALGLELLEYRVASVAFDARDFTSQSRPRQFLVGCPPEKRTDFGRAILDRADALGFSASRHTETTPIAACLTAHPTRLAAEDTYIYEPSRGLRVLVAEECEALQGFPRGWTAGFSKTARRRMLGNAVVSQIPELIGRAILEADAMT